MSVEIKYANNIRNTLQSCGSEISTAEISSPMVYEIGSEKTCHVANLLIIQNGPL